MFEENPITPPENATLNFMNGGFLNGAVKIVFGILLSVLSFSALKLYERMDAAERSIVALQITDAGRGEKLAAIDAKLCSIERKLDKIMEGELHK
jgi:hypothetical protein